MNEYYIKEKRLRQNRKTHVTDEVTGKTFKIPVWQMVHGVNTEAVKVRSCLKCQDRFPSFGPQNRICQPCRSYIEAKGSGYCLETYSAPHGRQSYEPIYQAI